MERQEHIITCFQNLPFIVYRVVLAVLIISSFAWCVCRDQFVTTPGQVYCRNGDPNPNNDSWLTGTFCTKQYLCQGYSNCTVKACPECQNGSSTGRVGGIITYCSTDCELKHFQCDAQGGVWDEANCQCITCDCGEYQQRCESVNGIFEGNCANVDPLGGQCCVGVCYICNTSATQTMQEFAKKVCCDQGLVPPKISDYCLDQPPSGKCGMVFSNVRSDFDSQWKCREITDDPAMMAWYRESCLSSSSGGSSSSAGGSSSSAGGSSSSGDGSSSSSGIYPGDCPECPWLDSILDTLTAQKHIVNNINNCLMNPSICFPSQSATSVQIDSSIVQAFRPYLDSLEKLSEQNNHILSHIDTGQRNILEQVLKIAKNDTALMQLLTGNFSNVENGLSSIDSRLSVINSSIHLLNDSIREYADSVSRSIGISTDSLIAHVDSIKSLIPSDILDSILKYQKLSAQDTGSVILGDLPGIDSLIDTTVKYWKRVIELDSLRHMKISDSLGSLHDAIDGLAWRMSTILGYGDTATTNLRGDINALEGVVQEFRDSSLYYWRLSLSADSAYRVQFGNDMQTVTGIMGTIVINQDTTNARLSRIGDVVGNIDARLSEGSFDTSTVYNGYLNGHDTSAVNFTNDLASAMNGALNDTTYSNIFVVSSSPSSSGSEANWVLPNVDSVHQVLRANVDSSLQVLTDGMENIFDTLRREFVLVNWDSAIIAPLGMKVPNTNTCPEDCFRIDLSTAGGVFTGVRGFDWGLCRTYSILGGLNVMQFLRLVLRIITAFACVYIGMWFIAGKKD